MKAVQTRHIAMSDMFRAIAGAPDAQFDVIACTVYSAAYSVMLANNKTQFNKLADDSKLYGADTSEANKLCKEAVGAKTLNAAAKHFKKTYAAIHATLAVLGIPDMVAGVPQGKANADKQYEMLDPLASDYADQFTSHFTMLMLAPAQTEAEREAAAAARAEKQAAKEKAERKAAREAEDQIGTRVRDEAQRLAGAQLEHASKPETIVQNVVDMLASGMLPAELETALIEAVRTRETALLLARVAAESEAVPA